MLANPPRKLQAAFGVSRIGRVTGLDRVGVEVACAVRPRGHVLQVSNGKGWTWAQAASSALSEAAELSASEQVEAPELRWATEAQMRAHFGRGAVWPVARWLEARDEARAERVRVAWRQARELGTGAWVWVPAAAVHCVPPGIPSLAPIPVRWTSNGLAAHPNRAAAVRHAVFELLEREALCRVLPDGWTRAATQRARVPASWVSRRQPRLSKKCQALQAQGIASFHFLWPPARTGLPASLAACLLFEAEAPNAHVAAGYACSEDPKDALDRAFLEAAQTRLTDIHGAREDVAPMNRADAQRLRSICEAARPAASLSAGAPRRRLPALASHLRRRGVRIAIAALTRPGAGLHVVRALSPDLRLSELL